MKWFRIPVPLLLHSTKLRVGLDGTGTERFAYVKHVICIRL
jgi:hypothetical protein